MSLRSFLYRVASIIGDFQAAQKGVTPLAMRLVRKEATKIASRSINRILRVKE